MRSVCPSELNMYTFFLIDIINAMSESQQYLVSETKTILWVNFDSSDVQELGYIYTFC